MPKDAQLRAKKRRWVAQLCNYNGCNACIRMSRLHLCKPPALPFIPSSTVAAFGLLYLFTMLLTFLTLVARPAFFYLFLLILSRPLCLIAPSPLARFSAFPSCEHTAQSAFVGKLMQPRLCILQHSLDQSSNSIQSLRAQSSSRPKLISGGCFHNKK